MIYEKIKNCNNLYILAILVVLSLLFIIIISITMKESFSYIKSYYPSDFNPNQMEKNDSTNDKYHVMYKRNNDYPNNDIITINNTSYATCLDGCITNPTCRGIVTDFEQGADNSPRGTCWRKHKMDDSNRHSVSAASKRYSTLLNR